LPDARQIVWPAVAAETCDANVLVVALRSHPPGCGVGVGVGDGVGLGVGDGVGDGVGEGVGVGVD